MNKLHKKLSQLESMIATQKDSVVAGGQGVNYMHGMANGMILAHSLFDESKPKFVKRPKKAYNRNVRHKCVKSRRHR
jgi:hypothetical protein